VTSTKEACCSMVIVPLHLAQANEYVVSVHRHHGRVVGYKFAVGLKYVSPDPAYESGILGAAICGRPVARKLDDGKTLEVLRLATTGAANACSMLYGACARIAREMGYERIITYTLESEPGTSLKASNWKLDGTSPGGSWSVPSRPRTDKHPTEPKKRWVLSLRRSG
jgi:hypothetical protein